jgi:DNA gyrase subunit B
VEWLTYNEKEIKSIFDKAASARKAREAAKKARDAARNIKPKEKGLKAKMQLSDKYVDCKSKDPKKRNLLLVEGLSAGGSVLESRNVETDCIYMLRGKIVSVLKATEDKVLSNQELSDIIRVVGAGFKDNFNLSKMQFDKIVITSDQDSDGFAIELLLIVFFYTYMRPLVEAGKLYRAVTPLYIVTTKTQKYYLYSQEELAEWKSSHNEKYDLAHCKGLGEVSAEVLKEICFEQQRYKRITVSDVEETKKLLGVLEGPAVEPRKQFIYDNATKLGFNFV